ncbi:SET domain-containing protein [Laetiporus sulphureus 93-53]|uniref:Histone-lysine N-methyltransferase, H3 lysine-36 specific n=1 Tax=Laetiporus sulphureus 93-53 TaxID=1314785 RepID=A0A165CRJ3_9APHY|nr:SET domain-containing protein [Laetiporus sulphureus 93-53]KZT03301.1 SET domain-containing protein [Laetiporus sulphureus 93-53]
MKAEVANGGAIGVKAADVVKREDIDDEVGASYNSHSASAERKQEHDIVKQEVLRPSVTPPVSSKKVKPEPQLIGHLPRAEEAALLMFVEIEENRYQYGTLGRSREALESMTCDCVYEYGVDDPIDACGHGSDCINRLTQVECLPDDCKCRSYCQNQRFQRRQYAPIEIVQTEKKGYGLRAAQDLPKDTFIYEYIGDVISQPSFLKRMRQYAEEGIRHFYFMMLQKDEFIDATKRGGIGRFANHSCNPNCYVAKWTVGHHVRMGIFANRNIRKDEELTFNYNVDRYGHDAQPCYCGEPNCVGFIGGKTQTDIAAMDDLYLDALGISEEVATLGLKGNKKRKSKKLDEDFIPTLRPLVEKDVPKVVQAMRQTQSRKVLVKLLMRIKLTEDLSPLRQIMRLRGFSVMTNVLEDYGDDVEMSTLAIECMMTWPLLQRNKVEDSKVNMPVEVCAKSDNQALAELAQKLLAQWENLEYAYRIPKRLKADGEEEDPPSSILNLAREDRESTRESKRFKYESMYEEHEFRLRSPSLLPKSGLSLSATLPPVLPEKEDTTEVERAMVRQAQAQQITAIIAQASAKAAAEALAAAAAKAEAEKKEADEAAQREARKSPSKHAKLSKEEKEANKEKRLLKLVGNVVVKCMSKHQKQMSHDQFKKHAKELTHIIAEKEKKSSSYREGKLDALSEEKTVKIKKFAKEYIAKVLRKLEKPDDRRASGSRSKPSSTANDSSSVAASCSGSILAPDESMPVISVDDMMDIDGSDHEEDEGHDQDMADGEGEVDSPDQHDSPPESVSPESTPLPPQREERRALVHTVSDPRLRHRTEESGWDPHQDNLAVLPGPSAVSVGS